MGNKKIYLKSKFGRISFGTILNAHIVSWSNTKAKDLLISRCWSGVYLYPVKTFEDAELKVEPLKVCNNVIQPTMAVPVDWNNDGLDELILTDRNGFIYYCERKGEYPDLSFELAEPLRDKDTGLVFNIPFENPNIVELDDLGGYIDIPFYNYIYPVIYNPYNKKHVNLIIGDWAGNLWWLPDAAREENRVEYKGCPYTKEDQLHKIKTAGGKKMIQKYGREYVKPKEKICDENGNPILLGDGIDSGIYFKGSNTRPFLYKNNLTGSDDLIVLAGTSNSKLYYLQRINDCIYEKPVFRNLGEIRIEGIEISDFRNYFSSYLIVNNENGWNDLIISDLDNFAILQNTRTDEVKPVFKFNRWVCGEDVITGGRFFSDVLDYKDNRRFFLDINFHSGSYDAREVITENGNVMLLPPKKINDQNGVFITEGETDPNLSPEFGCNRIARWDFDKSGKNHLIVGTDKGLLYLLKEGEKPAKEKEFIFRSFGPLKDSLGKVIRVHNRLAAYGIDLNGDGFEDLILGAATYQCGVKTDPEPGGGLYYLINKGLDNKGIPVFDHIKPLFTEGYEFNININDIVRIQIIDVDNDGQKEALISLCDSHKEILRVFKPIKDRIGLKYIGKIILPFYGFLVDIDRDGELEVVWAGGEQGIGYYQKVGREIINIPENSGGKIDTIIKDKKPGPKVK